MRTRFTIVTVIVFALALFLGAMTVMAQDAPGQTDHGGMSNTPGGGTSNAPAPGKTYERQGRNFAPVLLAEDTENTDTGGGMENTPGGGGTSNTPGKSYERRSGNAVLAQMNSGGMTNAPGGMMLPTLTGNKSSEFTATSKSDAQKICDQVAAQNGKISCEANSGTGANMWYCECK